MSFDRVVAAASVRPAWVGGGEGVEAAVQFDATIVGRGAVNVGGDIGTVAVLVAGELDVVGLLELGPAGEDAVDVTATDPLGSSLPQAASDSETTVSTVPRSFMQRTDRNDTTASRN